MKWFGRKAAQETARPALLRLWHGAASGGEWPRGYEAQVRDAYLHNPVAQRAVRLVAEGVGGAPVYALEGPERLARIAKAPQLLETIASQLLLHGNAFVQILLDQEGEPAELFALRPERVSVEADASGWPAAYVYKAGQAKTRLPARDGLGRPGLVHLKAMHPLDDHLGLGSLGAAAGAVAIHNSATRWNKALLDNAARPSGALVFDGDEGATLSAQQFERLPGQAQKELYHNEALTRLDAALHPAVEHAGATVPPTGPAEGQLWVLGSAPSGAWEGKGNALAAWTGGGWRFIEPQLGMLVWNKASGLWIHWTQGGWSSGELPAANIVIGGKRVLGNRAANVPSPSGGTVIDAEARAAVNALIAALMSHGLID